MIESAIAQGLFKIFLALVGIIAGRLSLMWMDKAVQRRIDSNKKTLFSEFVEEADNEELSRYYAARLIFVAIIVGCAIS